MKRTLLTLWLVLLLVGCGGDNENAAATLPITIAPSNTPGPAITPQVITPADTPIATLDTPPTVPPELVASATSESVPTNTPEPTIPASQAGRINLELLVEGLLSPVSLTHAGDERLFIVEQAGVIRIFQTGALLDEPFLDIQERVGSEANEQGFLGLAFHPDYASNGRFFVDYTDNNGDTVISEFRVSADPNQADGGSEQVLLNIDQPYENHNGGQIAFGPDGYLYIGMGDGGSQGDPHGNGQSTDTLLGKILRLDVDNGQPYAIPADNPFVNGGGRLEIWAYGFRNPWRFSFDRLTGDLFIGDVGQDSYEEIDFYPAGSPPGANFGWNVMEGWFCFNNADCNSDGLVLPIALYGRNEGCSVTGGYMYRGTQYPGLYGNYFFTDFCFGTIWGLFPADGSWLKVAVTGQTLLQITSFGEDMNGELYVLSRLGGLYQITE